MIRTSCSPTDRESLHAIVCQYVDQFLDVCGQCKADLHGVESEHRKAMEQIGRSEDLLFRMAKLLYATGDYGKAAKAAVEVTQLNPRHTRGYNLAGDSFIKLGEFEKARQKFVQAQRINPQDHHSRQSLSHLNELGQ